MSYAKNTRDWGRLGTTLTCSEDWSKPRNQFQVIDNKVIEFKKVVVHSIRMSDCEDPDLMVAQPIYEWQQTDAGKFVMERSRDTSWHRHLDYNSYGHVYTIVAELPAKDYTFWLLKWGTP